MLVLAPKYGILPLRHFLKKNNRFSKLFFCFAFCLCFLVINQLYTQAQEAQQINPKQNQNLQDRLDFANGLYNRNMYEMAIIEYDAILEENSTHPEAGDILFRLAESHFFLKKYEEAISLYQTFSQNYTHHPQIDTARLRLGESLYQLGDKDSSLSQMQNLTQNNDEKIRQMALYYTGKILYEKENYSDAKNSLLQLINSTAENPYQEIAHYYLGEIYLKMDDYKNAAIQFDVIKNSAQQDLKQLSLFNLGKAAYHQQDFRQASDFFHEASLVSENTNLSDDSFLNYLNSLYALKDFTQLVSVFNEKKFQSLEKEITAKLLVSNSYLQLKNNEEAIRLSDEIIRSPEIDQEQKETAELNKIEALIQIGDINRSKAALEEMPKTHAFFQDKWNFLSAQIYKEAHLADESIHHFDELIQNTSEANSYRSQALLGKAYTLLEAEKTDAARKTLNQFITDYPTHPLVEKAAYDHILLDVKLADWPGAIQRSKEFLEHFQSSDKLQDVHLRLASYYLQTNQYLDALAVYKEYLGKYTLSEEQTQEIAFYQAYANQLAKNTAAAIEFYKKIQPDKVKEGIYISTLKNLAFLYVSENQTADAADSYLKLIRFTKQNDLSPDVYFWLADHYLKEKDANAMLDILTSLQNQKDSSNLKSDIDYFLAEAHFLKKDFEKAKSLSEEAISLGTTQRAKTEFLLGLCFQQLNLNDDALVAFEKSLNSAGNQHRIAMLARISMADTYARLGQNEKAAKAYLAVAILYDDDEIIPTTLLNAGKYFEKASLLKEATTAYNELIDRFPAHELAITAKNELQKISTL